MSDYEKREIMYYAITKDPDQTAHLHALIRILTTIYSTVISVSLVTQLKMALCLPIFLDHSHNGLFQMLMFI